VVGKQHPNSFFEKINIDYDYKIFGEEPTYKGKPIVVLQTIPVSKNIVIFEIVFKEHYKPNKGML
jgi:hypothetical protein